MSDYDKYSRVNKFEKRRKNTKSLSIFIVLGIIVLVVLFAVIFFGGGDQDKNDSAASDKDNTPSESADNPDITEDESSSDEQLSSEDDNSSVARDDLTTDEDTTNTEEDSNAETDTEQVEPSDDNVVKAYTRDWKPVGTEQTGQHTTNYNEGTQDRKEMTKATAMATELDEDSLIMWWTKRNGDQKVVSTVSNHANTVYYRAYLSWVDDQGWKPTKVEELKENDQEYRFE